MPRSSLLSRLWIIGVLCLVLSGCSAIRLGYGQAPELAYWWLDGYADFDDTQSPRVRDALGQWFAWHRRTQLPDYAALLLRAQDEVLADTTPQRACRWWSELRTRIDLAFDQAVMPAADLAVTLTPQQIRHVERRYAKANEEFRDEYLEADAAQRLEASVKRAVERAENIYGRLDDAQRERVARSVAASPFDPELWLSERQRRQQDALQMLTGIAGDGARREAAQAALRAWRERVERSPREDYRRYAARLTEFNCSFAAALHNSTTPAQRQAAAAKFKGWEADMRALAASAGAVAP